MRNISQIRRMKTMKTCQASIVSPSRTRQQKAKMNLLDISDTDFINIHNDNFLPDFSNIQLCLHRDCTVDRSLPKESHEPNQTLTNSQQQQNHTNNETNLIYQNKIKKINNLNYHHLPLEQLIRIKNGKKRNQKVYEQLSKTFYLAQRSENNLKNSLFFGQFPVINNYPYLDGKTSFSEYLGRRRKIISRLKQHRMEKQQNKNNGKVQFKNDSIRKTIPLKLSINKSYKKQNKSLIVKSLTVNNQGKFFN